MVGKEVASLPNSSLVGLELISSMVRIGRPATAKELLPASGVPRATLYRALDALVRDGWVVAEGTPKQFWPSMHIAQFGLSWFQHHQVRDVVLSNAIDLARLTGRLS